MRLTLRNLLLYLDHQMDPADAEDFAEKIKQSEFATGLIERIRSVTKVRRMPAPKVDDKGLGGDANSIADYIENLLPAERIKDFDKLCLDSDMQLAEVASCHHILTLVLAQPVQPSDELRDRIYAIPALAAAAEARSEHGHAEAPQPPVLAPPVPAAAQKEAEAAAAALATRAESNEVPDYLRAGRSSGIWPVVGTVAATFLIVALLLRAMGPFDNRHPLARALGATPTEEVANNDKAPSETDEAAMAVPTNPEEGAMPEENGGDPNAPPEPEPATTTTSDPLPDTDVAPPPERAKPSTSVAANTARPVDPAEIEKPAAPTPTEPEKPEPTKPEEPESGAIDVGRYLSDEQMLGRFDATMGVWVRVPPRALLVAGEPLVSFPAFRPQVALGAGLQVAFVGEASVRLLAPDAGGLSNLFVDHGRLLITTDGKPGSRMRLNLAGLEGVLAFTAPGTEVAIEVRYYLAPGSDPEAAHGPRVIEISTLSGGAEWLEPDVEAVAIPAQQAFTFVEKSTSEVRGPFRAPDWVDARPTAASNLDRDTRLFLDRNLGYEKSLNLSLEERAEDRKVEVRSLAARCLVGLNKFGPALANLRDARLTSFWTYDAESLRAALAHGPETAKLIRQEIEGSREMNAPLLYKLLIGYGPEQLAADGATELVNALESPDLDVRVLAFDNLWHITGAMFNYRPERKQELNRTAVLRFREKLKDGAIVYKTPPSPLPDRKPVGK